MILNFISFYILFFFLDFKNLHLAWKLFQDLYEWFLHFLCWNVLQTDWFRESRLNWLLLVIFVFVLHGDFTASHFTFKFKLQWSRLPISFVARSAQKADWGRWARVSIDELHWVLCVEIKLRYLLLFKSALKVLLNLKRFLLCQLIIAICIREAKICELRCYSIWHLRWFDIPEV